MERCIEYKDFQHPLAVNVFAAYAPFNLRPRDINRGALAPSLLLSLLSNMSPI